MTSNVLSKNAILSDEHYVTKAAKILQGAVLSTIANSPELRWPPTAKSLQQEHRKHPELLQTFYVNMFEIGENHNKTSDRVSRLVDSSVLM